jgi:hypothetical protein
MVSDLTNLKGGDHDQGKGMLEGALHELRDEPPEDTGNATLLVIPDPNFRQRS